LQIDLLNRSV